jgi:hypothetical protein
MASRLLILYQLLFLFSGHGLFAREEKRVVVTGIKYILVENEVHHVNITTFPFYFNDDVFFNTISSSLTNALRGKFGVEEVTLMPGTEIKYGNGKPIRKVRPKIPENADENAIYVELASYFTYANFDSENYCYKLVTLFSAFDYNKKLLYHSENTTPIKVRSGDWIPSDTIMNWRDFEFFYILGIESAIKGDSSKLNLQSIDHQSAGEYDPFTFTSEKIKLVISQNSYFLEKSDQKKTELMNITVYSGEVLTEFGKNDGAYEFYLKNLPENKGYLLQLYGSKEYIDELNFSINVIAGLNEGSKIKGEFKLDYNWNMTGTMDGSPVFVYYNWPKSVAEFIIDSQMVALVHEYNNQRFLYYSPDTDSSILGKFSNLLVTYHLATIILNEAEKSIQLQNKLEQGSDIWYWVY